MHAKSDEVDRFLDGFLSSLSLIEPATENQRHKNNDGHDTDAYLNEALYNLNES